MISAQILGIAKAQAELEKKKLEIKNFTDRVFMQALNLQKHLALDTPQYTGNTAANWQAVTDPSFGVYVRQYHEESFSDPDFEPFKKGDPDAVDASMEKSRGFLSVLDTGLPKRTMLLVNPAPLSPFMEEAASPSGRPWRFGNLSIDNAVQQFLSDVLRM